MEVTTENRSPGKLFSWIERVGNKIPNPFLLFVYLIVVLMVATAIISGFDLAVKNPTNGELVRVNNLLSVAGLDLAAIDVVSHGETELLVPTADGVFEARNRRVEITVR